MELLGERFEVDLLQELLDGLGTHAGVEIVLILLAHIAILFFAEDLVADQRRLAGVGDDIGREVQHLLQNTGADVEQQTHAGGDALEVPDVGNGRRQLDVAHALAAHLRAGDLDAAAVADLALVADLLILAAVALPVLRGAKDALAEQAVALGLEGAVVDGLGLFDLAVRPFTDHLRRSDSDFNGVKRCVTHFLYAPPFLSLPDRRRQSRR